MKKLYISMPMSGMSREEIVARMAEAKIEAERLVGEPVELIDSVFDFVPGVSHPVKCIGRSIMTMADADCVYFAGEWGKARGCLVEFLVAGSYGIPILNVNLEGHNG